MDINWYPGHMAKTKRLINEKIDLIDIIFEIIDARIPDSSKIKDLDQKVKNKAKILIMSKIDLCDINETNKWIKYYESMNYKVIGVDLLNGKNLDQILIVTKEVLKEFNLKRLNKGMKERAYRALVIGIPNVGKSTLINKLAGKKVTKVGNMPGVTKSLDWIRLNKELELLDSPGILWPRMEDSLVALNLASMMAIKEEILPLYDVCAHILKVVNKYYPEALKARYNIDGIDTEDIINTFDLIGKKRGCIIKGGEVDYGKVETLIIRDLNDGNLGPITFDRYKEKENQND
ncbi:MAG: ribosome biogenesis GTPase YlqF [Bacilli bacterium]|nr:ribosome biogenesis GTPase YlqF [Bacilli bacterium]